MVEEVYIIGLAAICTALVWRSGSGAGAGVVLAYSAVALVGVTLLTRG